VCSSDLLYQDSVICQFGTCRISIPSSAMHTNATIFYVDVTSDLYETYAGTTYQTERTTIYSLSATLGQANCRPFSGVTTTGFCSSLGSQLASGLTLWNTGNDTAKHAEAQCRYNKLINWCPFPTPQCQQALQAYSCFESFPQCDAGGFALGTCLDVCNAVEQYCGSWCGLTGVAGTGSTRPELRCSSNKFVTLGACTSLTGVQSASCGDGVCSAGENCITCPTDCGLCPPSTTVATISGGTNTTTSGNITTTGITQTTTTQTGTNTAPSSTQAAGTTTNAGSVAVPLVSLLLAAVLALIV